MGRRYFGTDGIRGRVGETPITADFMLHLGWAAGKVFARQGKRHILIGKDTRLSGYMFESALEAGLSAAGVDVSLVGPMPTPAIAYLTQTFHADAGIVISASHNPFEDNGIKFFSGQGEKLADEIEAEIERWLDTPMETVAPAQLGKARRIADAAGRYIEFCKNTLAFHTSLKGLHIVLDCAHGATYHIAPAVFSELGAQVSVIGNQPDGLNINKGVGSTHPEALQAKVVELGADLGIAFDGDGDRVMMVNHTGRLIDGDDILYIIARYLLDKDRLKGGVVGTLMSNFGLEMAFKALDVPFVRAQVGDRYVMAELQAQDWLLGGETSGHIVCRHVQSTGDGIVSALQVVAAMARSGSSLDSLLEGLKKLPQSLVNVRVTGDKTLVMRHPQVVAAVADVDAQFAGRGRVLLRPSGTEPLLRVMVEGEDSEEVQQAAEQIARVINEVVA
ncbi:phosphoglucosamine mutase [Terasakiispira papahanaumokuakeensis]|uniref:Phosphoglucosamine mutase n=1 Tax=Terasakiispira papahanaumokuakeensis TaxID=197479 RepID=A0A1E2VCV8_9GAMM|nr:phosphoglucosamine mutase [Terasakiispira papahanaumokuakeensis]ODC04858.1 phosphoglucosamine mutase [Terasakiispira papahanaumokuakeensis]